MKKWLWIIGVIFIIIFSIIIGYFVIINSKTSKEENNYYKELANTENINKINNSDIIVTSYSGIKITPNTKIVYETYYKKCNHKEVKEEKPKEEIVNLNEKELQEKYKDYSIKQFGTERVVLYKEDDGFCKEHYMIKEDEGIIAVYKINNLGTEELMDLTDIVVQYLPETDKINIQKGIEVYGEKNLDKILEDFE